MDFDPAELRPDQRAELRARIELELAHAAVFLWNLEAEALEERMDRARGHCLEVLLKVGAAAEDTETVAK